ncbi:unnamed protein product [Ixodes pacificus]
MEDDWRNRTLWCGGLDAKVTEDLLRELFVQGGPVEEVKIPKTSDGQSKNFAFVTFVHADSLSYSLALLEGTCLFGRRLKLERRPRATIDDKYVDMMNRHYEHVRARKARRSQCGQNDQYRQPNHTHNPSSTHSATRTKTRTTASTRTSTASSLLNTTSIHSIPPTASTDSTTSMLHCGRTRGRKRTMWHLRCTRTCPRPFTPMCPLRSETLVAAPNWPVTRASGCPSISRAHSKRKSPSPNTMNVHHASSRRPATVREMTSVLPRRVTTASGRTTDTKADHWQLLNKRSSSRPSDRYLVTRMKSWFIHNFHYHVRIECLCVFVSTSFRHSLT